MTMMVVASLHEHALPALDKPRVISEIKKSSIKKKLQPNLNHVLDSKPRISGELEWCVNGCWELRHVEVRDGSLLVYNRSTGPQLRLPLRHLSLQPANRPRTFSLVREHQSLVTLQAGTDEQYERWVKTLAVELIRQTPLEAIRFLDILGITATIASARRHHQAENKTEGMRRGLSENNLSSVDSELSDNSLRNSSDSSIKEEYQLSRGRPKERSPRTCLKKSKIEECPKPVDNIKELLESHRGRTKERNQRVRVGSCVSLGVSVQTNGYEDRCKRPLRAQSSDPVRKMSDSDSEMEDVDEKEVAALLLRCQQVDNYVPVREKRRLFESLCRRGRRLAQSSDNLSTPGVPEGKMRRKKRARSLHDLNRCNTSNVAVREICRYFEQRGQEPQQLPETTSLHKPSHTERSGCSAYLSRRRVQRGERRLARVKQQVADCEETIWRLQEEMASLDCHRSANSRSQDLRLYAALEMRLAEEEARLCRLQEDAARTLREVELATDKFETALVQSSEELSSKNSGRQ